MGVPYTECAHCLVQDFCPRCKGEADVLGSSFCCFHDRLYKCLAFADIPKRYLGASLYNCTIDKENEAVVHKVEPLLRNIKSEVDDGLNVFIHGDTTGTGKTYVASMFLNHYIYQTCGTRFDFEHPLALYADYSQLIDDLRYLDNSTGIQERFEMIKNVPLLLLDDLGAGTMSDYAREQTYLLLNYRFNNELSTIATSNLSFKQLSEDKFLGGRNTSRILSNCMLIKMSGRDRRTEGVRH